jgi:hypothetical protein
MAATLVQDGTFLGSCSNNNTGQSMERLMQSIPSPRHLPRRMPGCVFSEIEDGHRTPSLLTGNKRVKDRRCEVCINGGIPSSESRSTGNRSVTILVLWRRCRWPLVWPSQSRVCTGDYDHGYPGCQDPDVDATDNYELLRALMLRHCLTIGDDERRCC